MNTNLFSNSGAAGFATNSQAGDPATMDDRDRHHRQGNISDPSLLPDRDLYKLCQEYGANARLWSRKFASLLPEVARRQLYKRHGFYSIYEFAGKLAGMSHKTVDEVLRIYRRVEGKPLLKKEIEKVGWAKVRAVAALAGKIEEENLVEMIKTLPRGALEECVRELKRQNVPAAVVIPTTDVIPAPNVISRACLPTVGGIQQSNPLTPTCWGRINNQNGMLCEINVQKNSESYVSGYCGNGEVGSAEKSARIGDMADKCESRASEASAMADNHENKTSAWPLFSFRVSPETEFRFRKLQQKLEKERKQKVNFNEVLSAVMDLAEELTSLKNAGRRQKETPAIMTMLEELKQKKKSQGRASRGQNQETSEKSELDRKTFKKFEKIQNGEKQAQKTKALKGHPLPRTKPLSSSSPKACLLPSVHATRHIPASTKRAITQKHHHKCAFPGCNRPHEVLHHPERFALKKSHENLTPLCKNHHYLAHAGLVAHESSSPENWRIKPKRDKIDIKCLVDGSFLKKSLSVLTKTNKCFIIYRTS